MATQQQSLLISISSNPHDDLSNWELISDVSDDDSIFGVQSYDLDESIHSLSSSSDLDDDLDQQEVEEVEVQDDLDVDIDTHVNNLVKFGNFGLDLSNFDVNYHQYCDFVDTQLVNSAKVDNFGMDLSNIGGNYNGYCDYDDRNENISYVEDDDNMDDDDDIDDDLVPWEMKGVYMRERIKKSGKKSLIKLGKSKKVQKSVRKYGLIAY